MDDFTKSKQQLIDELNEMRARIAEIEAAPAEKRPQHIPSTGDDLPRLLRERAVISELARIITSSLNIDEVYEQFAREVRKLIDFDIISISIVTGSGAFVVAYTSGIDIPGRPLGEIIDLDGSGTGITIEKGAVTVLGLDDEEIISSRLPGLTPPYLAGLRVFMGAPLSHNGQTIGALVFTSKDPNAFGEREMGLAERVAAQIAGAITNSQLYADLKRAEANLRSNERRFRSIVNAIPSPVLITRISDGKILFANKHMEAQFGLPPEELVGRFAEEFYSDIEDRQQLIKELEEEGFFSNREVRGKKLDGTDFWVNVSAQPTVFDGENALFTGFHDITARKLAEDALKESESRFRTLAETTPASIFIFQGTTLRYVNRGAELATGYSHDEMVGKEFWFLIHPDQREDAMLRGLARQRGEPFEGRQEVKIITKSGNVCWMDYAGVTIDIDGQPAVLGTALDITSRKQHVEALRISESKNRALVNTVPDAIFQIAGDGTFLDYVQGEGIDLLMPPEEFLGKSIRDTMPLDFAAQSMECIEAALSSGRMQSFEYRLPTAASNGEMYDYEARIVVSGDDEVLAIVRDVTERNRLVEQLHQAQRMEAVGQLAGGIAHDFNNLLSVIMSYAELCVFSYSEDARLTGYIDEIQKSAERAANLTDQLLAFSRRQRSEPRLISLNHLVLNLENMIRSLTTKAIKLTLDLHPELSSVKADPNQMERVLINLVVNARDAMPNGGRIVIETTNVDGQDLPEHLQAVESNFVMLCVSDTGPGIAEDVKPHIFDPFFTTKEPGKGTGLGLSTCYGIVVQNGGFIEAESKEGIGAVFKVYLPKVIQESSPLPVTSDADQSPPNTETLMIVDDNPDVLRVVSALLKQQGYTVLEASNGKEALNIANGRDGAEIHLLLTDVVMPYMNGKQLVECLKESHPDTIVVYTSGYGDEELLDQSETDSRTLFTQKPYSPSEIIRLIRESLDKHVGMR